MIYYILPLNQELCSLNGGLNTTWPPDWFYSYPTALWCIIYRLVGEPVPCCHTHSSSSKKKKKNWQWFNELLILQPCCDWMSECPLLSVAKHIEQLLINKSWKAFLILKWNADSECWSSILNDLTDDCRRKAMCLVERYADNSQQQN